MAEKVGLSNETLDSDTMSQVNKTLLLSLLILLLHFALGMLLSNITCILDSTFYKAMSSL